MSPPPPILIDILTPKAMVLGGGAFGNWLGHEGRDTMNGINALRKETLENSVTPFDIPGYSKKMVIY